MPLFREQFMIVVSPTHPLARKNAIRSADLNGERYLNRINCEFIGVAAPIWEQHGAKCEMVYRSERDDWILAMIAAGLGFGFMPEHSITHPGIVARPLIEPEFWREVNLVTVRGRPHSPAVGALVREAMRAPWMGKPALAVAAAKGGASAAGAALHRRHPNSGALRSLRRLLARALVLLVRLLRLRVGPGDQPRAALERDVVPRPVERHDDAVAEADEEVDVRDAPQQPGEEAGERQPAELDDGALAPDGRERAGILEAERWLSSCPRGAP